MGGGGESEGKRVIKEVTVKCSTKWAGQDKKKGVFRSGKNGKSPGG